MKHWSLVGEFFLFRWLFGDYQREEGRGDLPTHRNDYYGRDKWRNYQSPDEFHEEQDDYDMMDDF